MKPPKKRASGRPAKPRDERASKFSITLQPRAAKALEDLMREEETDNRSAMIASLVVKEHARRILRRSGAAGRARQNT